MRRRCESFLRTLEIRETGDLALEVRKYQQLTKLSAFLQLLSAFADRLSCRIGWH